MEQDLRQHGDCGYLKGGAFCKGEQMKVERGDPDPSS